MWRYFTLRRVGAVLVETLLLVCCTLAGYFFRFLELPSNQVERFSLLGKALIVAVVFQLSLHLNDTYRFQGRRLSIKFVWLLLRAIVFAVCFMCFIFYTLPGLTIGRGVFAWDMILVSLFIFFWHTILCLYLRTRPPQTNLLVLGNSNLAYDAVREILNRPELGIRVIGFVTDASDADDVSNINTKIIGGYNDFPDLVSKHGVNHIIVGLSDSRKKLPIEDLLYFKTKGIVIEDVTAFYERIAGKIPIETLKPSWLVFNSGFNISKNVLFRKRIFSILLSTALLVLTSPILLLTMILIKLDSRGPVFYKQDRVGRNNRVFTLVKFRSMRNDAEKETGPVWSTPGNDSRVTRIGWLLRRTRIDELPQIYNVLRGDMDMIGPRPERPEFVNKLSAEIPYYPLRHVVKPGITGWAQINYGYANKLEHTVEKLQYDLFYIKNVSLTMDMMIAFETVKTVLVRKGS